MKSRKMFLFVLVVAGLMGAFPVGPGQALDFADWNQVWFKVQEKESGKIGDAIPPGSRSLHSFNDNHQFYLVVESFDSATASLIVTLCTFNGTLWIRQQPSGTWPLLTGDPEQFLTFFDLTFAENNVTTERFVGSLEVTAKVKNNNPHTITGASFKSLAGVFLEVFQDDPDEYATGSAKLTGNWISPDNVVTKVPDGCKLP